VLFLYPDRLKESLRKQKTAIRTDSGVGTVFMVAGACNRRWLHLDFASV
jgi:hypothetical protein